MDPIDARLQWIRAMHGGQNLEVHLERRLEQEQQRLHQTAAQITITLQQRQTIVATQTAAIAEEMESTPLFLATELQNKNLQETLTQLESTQEKLKTALQTSQNQLEQMQMKKIELTQSFQHLQEELKSTEAKSFPYQNELFAASDAAYAYLAKSLTKESS